MSVTLKPTLSSPTFASNAQRTAAQSPTAPAGGKALDLLRSVTGDSFNAASGAGALNGTTGQLCLPNPRDYFPPMPQQQPFDLGQLLGTLGSLFEGLGQLLQGFGQLGTDGGASPGGLLNNPDAGTFGSGQPLLGNPDVGTFGSGQPLLGNPDVGTFGSGQPLLGNPDVGTFGGGQPAQGGSDLLSQYAAELDPQQLAMLQMQAGSDTAGLFDGPGSDPVSQAMNQFATTGTSDAMGNAYAGTTDPLSQAMNQLVTTGSSDAMGNAYAGTTDPFTQAMNQLVTTGSSDAMGNPFAGGLDPLQQAMAGLGSGAGQQVSDARDSLSGLMTLLQRTLDSSSQLKSRPINF